MQTTVSTSSSSSSSSSSCLLTSPNSSSINSISSISYNLQQKQLNNQASSSSNSSNNNNNSISSVNIKNINTSNNNSSNTNNNNNNNNSTVLFNSSSYNNNNNISMDNGINSSKENVEIQAQFELALELRRFINIDLFQRGHYQIRLSIKCANKQIPTKIIVQLENNQNNNNLSDTMFPSCVIDDYAVSKTFLILYRNEEIILDDNIIFKISTLVNAFNLVDSFDRLDLQLNVELWFTENDYKPLVSSPNQSQLQLTPSSSQGNLQSQTSIVNSSSSNNNSTTSINAQNGNNNSNGMQQLCCRTLKIKFDPRQGIHVQMPVIFDYFHLSSVLITFHCTLLTLLPPVMLGTNIQRNSTLSSILFGKDLSQFKNPNEITPNLMKRAVYLHNQICSLLLTSYENLQDHIIKMSTYLNEYERKNLKFEYVNCKEKLHKICEIIQQCNDPETLDDMANRHVAQCSAENIMQWCLYLDHFTLNQSITPHLAIDYHNKRLKRFSESFFTRDFSRKLLSAELNDALTSDSYYNSLHDQIRSSQYYQLIPDLIISCDDLDGLPENMPIIFEENYIPHATSTNGNSFYNAFSEKQHQILNVNSMLKRAINNNTNNSSNSSSRSNSTNSFQNPARKTSLSSSNEISTENSSSGTGKNSFNGRPLTETNKKLHKKLKKKYANSGDSLDLDDDDFISNSNGSDSITSSVNRNRSNKSITLVSYKKTTEFFNDHLVFSASVPETPTSSNANNTNTPNSTYDSNNNSARNIQTKLSLIKADLINSASANSATTSVSSSVSTSSASSAASSSSSTSNLNSCPSKNLHSIIESTINVSTHMASASDLLFGSTTNQQQAPVVKKQDSIDESISENNNNNNKSIDLADISIGINQLDVKSCDSYDDDNDVRVPSDSKLNTSDKNQTPTNNQNSNNHNTTTTNNNANNANIPPSDCSFKSRVLYESFRGKNSTLERPKNHHTRRSILTSTSSVGANSNVNTIFDEHHHNENRKNSNHSTSSQNENDLNKSVDSSRTLSQYRSNNSTEYKRNNSENGQSSNMNTPVSTNRTKTLLRKQLTINTDNSSLSAVLNENIYKFVVAKEDLKRLISSKYQGNIYSEFSTLFCTAPYFYSELIPKIPVMTPQVMQQMIESKKDKNSSLSSSFMSTITSKSKLFKLFKSAQNENEIEQNKASDEHDNDEDEEDEDDDDEGIHLVVCVHGLDGNSGDLRLVRTYLELALPGARMDFLMSEHNQENTFDDIEILTKQLIKEINDHIETYGIDPQRISFIAHSLGNLIVRSTVAHEDFKPFANKLHTYLSLSGPHLGTLYNSSGLINMGMWLMQKWKKSGSLLQLSLKDQSDVYKTFLYKLSTKPTFELFKNVLLVSSPQDRYVPYHSARIEMCKAALKDSVYGSIYKEMVYNILKPIQENPNITFKRYSVFHTLPSGTSNFIGRAAHIAVLDSELFVEKLILVSAAKYFR